MRKVHEEIGRATFVPDKSELTEDDVRTFVIEAYAARAYSVWGKFKIKALTEEHVLEAFHEMGEHGTQDNTAGGS